MESYFERKEKISFIDNSISIYEKGVTLAISMLLAVCMDRFFVDKYWGVSVPIFTFAALIFFYWSTRQREKGSVLNLGENKLLKPLIIMSMVLIAFTFVLFSNMVLAFFNTIFMVSTFTLYAILSASKDSLESTSYLKKILERLVPRTLNNFSKPFIFLNELIKNMGKIEVNSELAKILKGVVLAIPLLIVILMLLSSADMIFNYYLSSTFRIFENLKVSDFGVHLVITTLFFLYIFGFMWSFKYEGIYVSRSSKQTLKADGLTVMPILLMLNVVYMLFSIIQFSYLYGGGNAVLPSGVTYAEYARRGFFELVAATIINFTIILCTMKFMKREKSRAEKFNDVFLSLLVVFTVNMLFSAHYKMSLYENIYGYTYLRVFVHFFMLLIFILFIIALAGIWVKKIPVTKLCIIASVIMYIILNYINVDVFIVKRNIQLYDRTKKLDVNYLCNLSYDVLPYLSQLSLQDNSDKGKVLKERLQEKQQFFLDKKYSWYEFNYSRYKSQRFLEKLKYPRN